MVDQIFGSAFSRASRTHWMLRELGLSSEKVKIIDVPIDLSRHQRGLWPKDPTQSQWYRENVNPDGRVPGFLSADGRTSLFESLAINYFLAKRERSPIAPANLVEEAQTFQWSTWATSHLEDACVNAMFAGMMRDKSKGKERREALYQSVKRPLSALEQALANTSGAYLLGDRFTVADLNVASVLSWGVASGFDLDPYPRVAAWWKACSSRPAFAAKL